MSEWPPGVAVRLLVGRARPFGPNDETIAIDKHPVVLSLKLTVNGFEDDEQAVLCHHGGPEKAVHHYPVSTTPHGVSNCLICRWNDSLGHALRSFDRLTIRANGDVVMIYGNTNLLLALLLFKSAGSE